MEEWLVDSRPHLPTHPSPRSGVWVGELRSREPEVWGNEKEIKVQASPLSLGLMGPEPNSGLTPIFLPWEIREEFTRGAMSRPRG